VQADPSSGLKSRRWALRLLTRTVFPDTSGVSALRSGGAALAARSRRFLRLRGLKWHFIQAIDQCTDSRAFTRYRLRLAGAKSTLNGSADIISSMVLTPLAGEQQPDARGAGVAGNTACVGTAPLFAFIPAIRL